jgi:hypothetical protein
VEAIEDDELSHVTRLVTFDPKSPLLPSVPQDGTDSERRTTLPRPEIMSTEWEKTLPKELQDYIEAQRQATRAATIAEIRLGKTDLTKDVQKIAEPLISSRSSSPKLGRKENDPLPRGVGRKYVADYWLDVPPSAVLSATNVRQGIYEKTGHKISFQTVIRAMDGLAEEGVIEKIDGTDGWRVKSKLRFVK